MSVREPGGLPRPTVGTARPARWRPRGLTTDEVAARRAAGRVNVVRGGEWSTFSQIIRANVLTRLNAILGALFVVVLVVGPVQDAQFGIVLAVNRAIGLFEEVRAKRLLDRLTVPRTISESLTDTEGRDLVSGSLGRLVTQPCRCHRQMPWASGHRLLGAR